MRISMAVSLKTAAGKIQTDALPVDLLKAMCSDVILRLVKG